MHQQDTPGVTQRSPATDPALSSAIRRGRALAAKGKYKAAADEVVAAFAQQAGPPGGVRLVLAGCTRSGKSILAERLAATTGYALLPGDRLRQLYWELEDPHTRRRARRQIVTRILETFPGGLILEGVSFHMKNEAAHGDRGAVSLALMRKLRDAGLADVVVVGNARSSVEQKCRALEAHRATGKCWTTNAVFGKRYSDPAALAKLAHNIIRRSRILRDKAASAGIPYLEIRPDAFEADIAAHLAMLRARLETAESHHQTVRSNT